MPASKVVATADFNTSIDGEVTEVKKGDEFPASSPIVKANAHVFEDKNEKPKSKAKNGRKAKK